MPQPLARRRLGVLGLGKLGSAVAGAGLDVYESEPLPPTDVWRTLDNVLLTPHLGYVNAENFQAFYANALEAVRAWAAGAPVHVLGGARG
ncbi:2-hydroxyacid dehydrogenase [Bordetella pertussis]|nr:2-hydroxyacid dehydrogenase [Bordetella pertussis]